MAEGAARRGAIRDGIAAALRDDLAAGRIAVGARLPTEAALARRFGVNRHTVREALARLAADGLVWSRRGAGTFAAARPTDYPLGRRVRFAQNLLAAGRAPSREVTALLTRPADADEARALRLSDGEAVHVFEGVSFADGVPIALFRSAFPAARLPDLALHLAADPSVTGALRRGGVADYVRAATRITARLAGAEEAARLRLLAPAVLICTTGVNVDDGGRPVELGVTAFAADRVTLTLGDGHRGDGDGGDGHGGDDHGS